MGKWVLSGCLFASVRARARVCRCDRVLTILKYKAMARALACNEIKRHSLHLQTFLHSPKIQ